MKCFLEAVNIEITIPGHFGTLCGNCHIRYLLTTQQDLESLNLSLNEAVHMAQNRPLWRMMSTFGTMHT